MSIVDESNMIALLKKGLDIMDRYGLTEDEKNDIAEGIQLHALYQIEQGKGPVFDLLEAKSS